MKMHIMVIISGIKIMIPVNGEFWTFFFFIFPGFVFSTVIAL